MYPPKLIMVSVLHYGNHYCNRSLRRSLLHSSLYFTSWYGQSVAKDGFYAAINDVLNVVVPTLLLQ